jgi:EAL domain-containing protein (putative c-di-GMP-specific phosphodiesterase class I)/GGDEF domain-containing protein
MVWLALAVLAALYVVLAAWALRTFRHARRPVSRDCTTELPDRVRFHDRMRQAIRIATRDASQLAVLVLELDDDTAAAGLTRALRASDSVAHLGGDAFAVLVTDVGGPDAAIEAANRVRAEHEASVGIALYPQHGEDPETLLEHAGVARRAAEQARSGHALFERDTLARLDLIADLRRGIDEEQLVLHFQPMAELQSGRIAGVEALVRWEHPERGLLHPEAFIALAETSGLIGPLTLHVLDRALARARAWMQGGLDLTMAVNISTRNLLDLTLPDQVETVLELHSVPPSKLELEFTEAAILADPPRAKAVLARLHALGVRLAVDDFGTGDTTLSGLRDLPLSTLKIDRAFVTRMATDEGDATIVRSTVQLGRSLGLKVVAEGVEDGASWAQLLGLGCDLAQGFHLSRPQPEATLTPWLRAAARASTAA